MPLENVFAFVNSNAGRFVKDDNFIVLKNSIHVSLQRGTLAGQLWAVLEGNVELNAISGGNQVVRFGPFAVQPYAILAEELSYIADGKPFLQKIL